MMTWYVVPLTIVIAGAFAVTLVGEASSAWQLSSTSWTPCASCVSVRWKQNFIVASALLAMFSEYVSADSWMSKAASYSHAWSSPDA